MNSLLFWLAVFTWPLPLIIALCKVGTRPAPRPPGVVPSRPSLGEGGSASFSPSSRLWTVRPGPGSYLAVCLNRPVLPPSTLPRS